VLGFLRGTPALELAQKDTPNFLGSSSNAVRGLTHFFTNEFTMSHLTKQFVRQGLHVMLCVCCFSIPTHAEDPTPGAEAIKKILTVEQFKEHLPEHEIELDLAGFVKLKQQGPLVVLDVRSKETFASRHLKGSVNIPLTELTEHTLPEVAPDKDVPIVLACDYTFFPTRMISMTIQAYPVLKASGYRTIYRLNLWLRGDHMVSTEAQEQVVEFEGTSVE
jgi:hypothetical protein